MAYSAVSMCGADDTNIHLALFGCDIMSSDGSVEEGNVCLRGLAAFKSSLETSFQGHLQYVMNTMGLSLALGGSHDV